MSESAGERSAAPPRESDPATGESRPNEIAAPAADRADAAPANGKIGLWIAQARLAAAFLTVLPVGPEGAASLPEVAASFGWFPLIGFAIGGAVGALDWLLALSFGNALRAAIDVAALTAITGALHLDGLADTADALGAGRDRERALAIMRDSHIGSYGAIALILLLALKMIALAGLSGAQRYAALFMAAGLARWAMVAAAHGLEYLRTEGAGSALLARAGSRNLRVATVATVIMLVPLTGMHALRASAIAAMVTLALRACYRLWVGGVTGDMIGAAGEIVETAVLIAVAG